MCIEANKRANEKNGNQDLLFSTKHFALGGVSEICYKFQLALRIFTYRMKTNSFNSTFISHIVKETQAFFSYKQKYFAC